MEAVVPVRRAVQYAESRAVLARTLIPAAVLKLATLVIQFPKAAFMMNTDCRTPQDFTLIRGAATVRANATAVTENHLATQVATRLIPATLASSPRHATHVSRPAIHVTTSVETAMTANVAAVAVNVVAVVINVAAVVINVAAVVGAAKDSAGETNAPSAVRTDAKAAINVSI